MTPTRVRAGSPVSPPALPAGVRALWFLAAAVAVPAWAHWDVVVGELDLASMATMTPARFLLELGIGAALWLLLAVLPCALLLRWRRRRRGPRGYDRTIAAATTGAALLLALHTHLTAFAPFYGNTWARWEPTFELFLPWWPAVAACVAATVALEMLWPRRG